MYVTRVTLFDPWAYLEEVFSHPRITAAFPPEERQRLRAEQEERMSDTCPRDMRLPVVEYECAKPLTARFCLTDWLDAPPVHADGATAWLMKPDAPTGLHGLPLCAATMDSPVPADTEVLRAELFSVTESVPTEPVDI